MRSTSAGRQNIRAEISLTADGDAYGNTMGWLFPVAETLHVRGASVPAELEFHAGHSVTEDGIRDSYAGDRVLEMLDNGEASTGDLQYFGRVLNRYAGLLHQNGRSY